MKNALILLRGLPGSGKSALAKLLSENGKYPIFSIDDYFLNKITGDYIFDFNLNHLGYKQCEENTRISMKDNIEKIFVHNTFTIGWELEIYFKLAKTHDYNIYVVTVEKYHDNKNIHGVSEEQLNKMAEKYKIKLL